MKEHQEPFVSIIMPVMYDDQYLKLALESVKKQLYTNYELLIIGSMEVIESIRNTNPVNGKTVYIDSKETTDSGGRRNIGIQQAKGKYILFLDSDDEYYDSNSVQILVEKIEKYKKLSIVGGSCIIYQQDKDCFINRSDLVNHSEEKISFKEYQNESGFYRFIYKKSFLVKNNIKFSNLKRFQDSIFMVRTLMSTKCFLLIKEKIYIYRKGHKKLEWSLDMYKDHLIGVLDVLFISKKKQYYALQKKMLQNIKTTKIKRIPKLRNFKELLVFLLLNIKISIIVIFFKLNNILFGEVKCKQHYQ